MHHGNTGDMRVILEHYQYYTLNEALIFLPLNSIITHNSGSQPRDVPCCSSNTNNNNNSITHREWFNILNEIRCTNCALSNITVICNYKTIRLLFSITG